jgi:glycosyltransferase involved in cell wall biosynthesis
MRLGVNLLPWRLQASRAPRPKLVVTFHDLKEPYILPKIGPARHLATIGLAVGSDAAVATNAEDFVRIASPTDPSRLRPTWGGRPLAAIPIGSNIPGPGADYDRATWRARLNAGPSDVVVAFFGFLGPDKGTDDLITAFEDLVRRGRPVRLVMVGATRGDSGRSNRPYEAVIRERLDAGILRERVAWTGFLAPSDVAAHLRAADLCCLPFVAGASLRHGTLMAAIAQGLPLVTTTPPATPMPTPFPSLRDSVDALLVPPRNPGALAAAIDHLVVDGSLRQRIGQGALRLSERFGWDTIARQTIGLYERLS